MWLNKKLLVELLNLRSFLKTFFNNFQCQATQSKAKVQARTGWVVDLNAVLHWTILNGRGLRYTEFMGKYVTIIRFVSGFLPLGHNATALFASGDSILFILKVIKSFSFAWYTLSLILLLTEIEIFLYWILILLLQGKLPAPAVCTTYTVIHLAQTLLKCFKENGYRFNVKAIVTR